MADRTLKVILAFAGGWATDFGPSFVGAPQNGVLQVPWLDSADNVFYELDGGPHKIGGSTRLNATAISSGSNTVHGMFQAWYQGTGGSETQIEWAYAGTELFSMPALSGTWTSRASGLEDNREPHFFMASDLCIWASNSNTDVPRALRSTPAVANLLGSPPNFAFGAWHKNRAWAAGVATNPSRLYYSASLDPEDWTGSGSGSIDIDPSDGDRIVGVWSHKNDLIVFKGPNRLSIHRITGSSPTGSDAFARIPFVAGIGGINQNTITTMADDLVFASPRGLHSLNATASFGDYIEAFLSRPILRHYQEDLNHSALNTSWGVNYFTKGVVLWTVPKSGGTTKNELLCYDYRFQPGRWHSLGRVSTYVNCHSLALLQTSRVHRLYAGLTTGFVQRIYDVADRSLPAGGAYTGEARFPYVNFGSAAHLKGAEAGFVSFLPKGNYTMTVGWTRDAGTEETVGVNQSGGDTLG